MARILVVLALVFGVSGFADPKHSHDDPTPKTKESSSSSTARPDSGKEAQLTAGEIRVLKKSFPAWHDEVALKAEYNEKLPNALLKSMVAKDESSSAEEIARLFRTRDWSNTHELVGEQKRSGDKGEEDRGEIGKLMAETNKGITEKETNSNREFEFEKRIFWAGRWLLDPKDPAITSSEAQKFIREFEKKWAQVKKEGAELVDEVKKVAGMDPKSQTAQDFVKKMFDPKTGVNLRLIGQYLKDSVQAGEKQAEFAANLIKAMFPGRDHDGNVIASFKTPSGIKEVKFGKTPEDFKKTLTTGETSQKIGSWTLVSPTAPRIPSGKASQSSSDLKAKTQAALNTHCASCHTGSGSGVTSLNFEKVNLLGDKAVLSKMAVSISSEKMPQGKSLAAAERTQLVNWLNQLAQSAL